MVRVLGPPNIILAILRLAPVSLTSVRSYTYKPRDSQLVLDVVMCNNRKSLDFRSFWSTIFAVDVDIVPKDDLADSFARLITPKASRRSNVLAGRPERLAAFIC